MVTSAATDVPSGIEGVTPALYAAGRACGRNHRRHQGNGGVRVTRSAREVVELYNLVVWNERDFALAEELMGDTVIRHEVGEATTLTHDQAVARIVDTWGMFDKLRFDLKLVVAADDGEHVAIVYQSPMELKDGTKTDVGSMEIFRVVDGRITEVWNCGYKQGIWQ
jgi:predicted SnoaL-like aldol condensation-catalyzing enzyme